MGENPPPSSSSGPSPTLRQIAAVAGVHHSTLSRALRGHPRVSRRRTAELRALAERMGYVPDPILGALMTYRTSRRPVAFHATIAWLNPSHQRSRWGRKTAYAVYFESAAARARQLGFSLEEIVLPADGAESAREARVTSMLKARNVQAIIVGPTPAAGMALDFIDWSRFSAIRIGYSLARPRLHIVTVNHFRTMTTIFQNVRALGYRRPGLFITRILDERIGRQWSASFLREQLELPAEDRVPPHLNEDWTEVSLNAWLDANRPDVVIGMGDGWLRPALLRHGLRVPEDIGIAVLAQPGNGQVMTGIEENNAAVGKAAVNLVVDMLNRQERGIPDYPQTVLTDNGWLDGGTLRRQ